MAPPLQPGRETPLSLVASALTVQPSLPCPATGEMPTSSAEHQANQQEPTSRCKTVHSKDYGQSEENEPQLALSNHGELCTQKMADASEQSIVLARENSPSGANLSAGVPHSYPKMSTISPERAWFPPRRVANLSMGIDYAKNFANSGASISNTSDLVGAPPPHDIAELGCDMQKDSLEESETLPKVVDQRRTIVNGSAGVKNTSLHQNATLKRDVERRRPRAKGSGCDENTPMNIMRGENGGKPSVRQLLKVTSVEKMRVYWERRARTGEHSDINVPLRFQSRTRSNSVFETDCSSGKENVNTDTPSGTQSDAKAQTNRVYADCARKLNRRTHLEIAKQNELRARLAAAVHDQIGENELLDLQSSGSEQECHLLDEDACPEKMWRRAVEHDERASRRANRQTNTLLLRLLEAKSYQMTSTP